MLLTVSLLRVAHLPSCSGFLPTRRDSYLPQGSHGLKAVTKYKLGEVNEWMCRTYFSGECCVWGFSGVTTLAHPSSRRGKAWTSRGWTIPFDLVVWIGDNFARLH